MTNELEAMVTETLREQVDVPVETPHLVAGATGRGRALRRRRRATLAGLTGAVAAAAVVGATVLPKALPRHSSGTVPTTSAVPGPYAPPALPPAPGLERLREKPSLVGSDPRYVHFTVDALTRGADEAYWYSGPNLEAVTVTRGSSESYVSLSTDTGRFDDPDWTGAPGDNLISGMQAHDTTIAGRPGQVQEVPQGGPSGPLWVLNWDPVRGLHARVVTFAATERKAVATAATLNLDHSGRCALPYRLTTLPRGVTPTSCATVLDRSGSTLHADPSRPGQTYPLFGTSLTLTDRAGTAMMVTAEPQQHQPAVPGPNRRVAGRPARWVGGIGKDYLEVDGFHGLDVHVQVNGILRPNGEPTRSGFTEADATRVVTGMRVAPDLRHPGTW